MKGTLPERYDPPRSPEAARAARNRARRKRLQRRRRRMQQLCIVAVIAVAALSLCAYGFLRQGTEPENPVDVPEQNTPDAPGTPDAQGNGTQPDGDAVSTFRPEPDADPAPEPAQDPVPDPDPEPETPLDLEIQKVLGAIITVDMTKMEQARAVFDFTKSSIAYTGDSDKSDWKEGAYTGLTTRRGDCFTYYAVSRALLDALGIDNLEVTRLGGPTSHYWNLVNCGDGWYHFDATPRSSKMPYFVSFMFTDEEAADYTERAGRNYYTFDGSLYPERATEKISEN